MKLQQIQFKPLGVFFLILALLFTPIIISSYFSKVDPETVDLLIPTKYSENTYRLYKSGLYPSDTIFKIPYCQNRYKFDKNKDTLLIYQTYVGFSFVKIHDYITCAKL